MTTTRTHDISCRAAADRRESVPTAWRRGVYAIHGERGRWVVDHLPTGLSVLTRSRKADALSAARSLYKKLPAAGAAWDWEDPTRDEDFYAMETLVLGLP